MKNYLKLSTKSIFHHSYLFIDVGDYLADDIFITNKLKVKFGKEYKKPNSSYVLIFCKIKKWQEQTFIKCMNRLKQKAVLAGYSDYEEACKELSSVVS